MQIWVTGWWWSREFTDPDEALKYYRAIGRRMKIISVLGLAAVLCLAGWLAL